MRRALLPVSALLLAVVGIWSIGVAGFTFPWNGWVAAAGTWGWTAVISGFWIAGWWSRFRWCWLALAVLELGALVWFLHSMTMLSLPACCETAAVWVKP